MSDWKRFDGPGRGPTENRAIVALRVEAKTALRLRFRGSARDLIAADRVRLEVNRATGQIALHPDPHGRKVARAKGSAYISVTGLDAIFPVGSQWELIGDGDGAIGHPIPAEGGTEQ